ncbi:MAG: type VI secretion system ATPase TssH, partial [Desulfovibrio sp.]|nr:type VI secretion system ATPase TssH [Desulfovibrio sp.]
MDINKFTDKAKEAVGEAQSIAAGMGHQETDAEHLALALVQQEKGIVPRILEQMGIQVKAFAVAIEGALRKRPSVSGTGMDPTKIVITQRLATILGEAQNEAKHMKDEYVSVDHIFAAMTDVEPGSPLGAVLKEYNVTRARFRQAMETLRGGARVTSANPEDTFEALSNYARDLVEAARQGKMDPVIGRDAEIRRVIRILSRRT